MEEKDIRRSSRHWDWVVIIIVVLVTAGIRIRLLEVPLERDEGEYAYMGQLLLQGIPPYAEAYNMKFPGIYFIYALILAVFGQTHVGIHTALLFVNAATVILVFLLGKRLFDRWTGVTAGGSYAVLTLSPSVQGFWANSEHFVVLFAMGGILLLLSAIDSGRRQRFFWSGLLLGLGFIIKQHGILFAAFGAGYLAFVSLKERPYSPPRLLRRLGCFCLGIFLPFALLCAVLALCGVFDRFWFWTFKYASKYASAVALSSGLTCLRLNLMPIVRANLLIWLAGIVGVCALLRDKQRRLRSPFVLGFIIASFLATCPGFYFRPHYFILFLPGVSLAAGIGMGAIAGRFPNVEAPVARIGIPALLAFVILCHPLFAQRVFLFQMTPQEVCRKTYGSNPFPESLEIARYIERHTSENDRIAVIGSEPQIYFYSKRRAATGHIYTYALMETHEFALQMQQEMIREIESARPEYLVLVNVETSWLIRPASERLIMQWVAGYIQQYYDRVGIADIIPGESTAYRWDDEEAGYSPRSKYWVSVFKRRS